MEKINFSTLQNGVRIVSEKIPYVKSFALGFWFDVGSKNESKTNNGISHFIEHMVFKGTSRRSSSDISNEIESLGGYLNAFTSKEQTCYYGRGLSRNIEKTFDVISDMIQNPKFDTEDINNESSVINDELLDIEDSPEELIFDKFEAQLFNNSSFMNPIIGTSENILKFTKHDLIEYHRKNYTFSNLIIVAVGDIEHTQIVDLASKYLNSLAAGCPEKIESKFSPKPDLFVEKNIQQYHLIVGRDSCGYSDINRIPLTVLSTLFGDGSSSRLFQNLREKNGIAYQINTFTNIFKEFSSFGIYLSTNEKSILKAHDIIFEEIEKLIKEPITAEEVNRAKEYFKGNLIISLENLTNRMTRIAHCYLYLNEYRQVEEVIRLVDKIRISDLKEITEEIFNEDKLIKVLLSPKNLNFLSVA